MASVNMTSSPPTDGPSLSVTSTQAIENCKVLGFFCPPWQASGSPNRVLAEDRLIILLEPLRRCLDRGPLHFIREQVFLLSDYALKVNRVQIKRLRRLQTSAALDLARTKGEKMGLFRKRWLDGAIAPNPRPLVGNTTTFTRFAELPIELRKIIWKSASHIQRILEVKNQDLEDSTSHAWRIAPASRRPPHVLHVCREARTEAFSHYQTLNGWSTPVSDQDTDDDIQKLCDEKAVPQAFYNRNVDILYIGPEVRLETLNSFIARNPNIPRVALEVPGKVKYPHISPSSSFESDWEEVIPRGCWRLNATLRILHGFHAPKDSTDPQNAEMMALFPGLKELKEIILVVDASPVYLSRQTMSVIDDAVGLVPVDEKLRESVTIYNIHPGTYQKEIGSITNGDGILDLGEKCSNIWTGEAMPRFSLQRLYLQSHSQNVFRRWFLRLTTHDQVFKVWEEAAKTMKQCNCVIRTFPRGLLGDGGDYSVMFGGPKIEVQKAMLVLIGSIYKREYLVGVDLPLIDLPEACIPQSPYAV
ncbi:hypothetical protein V8E51_002163 [Hyaloscypha variabilis]